LGGTPPFGWRVSEAGDLVKVPEQQAAINRIHTLRSEGLSLHKIAAALKAEGISLSHMGVKKVLAATSPPSAAPTTCGSKPVNRPGFAGGSKS
jgi:putative DNA-invertase from lambdoid prophage Rac